MNERKLLWKMLTIKTICLNVIVEPKETLLHVVVDNIICNQVKPLTFTQNTLQKLPSSGTYV